MIRYGDAGSIPKLKELWKTCFSDEDAYIDAFFHALYEDEDLLLEEENGVLLGASFFLPGRICIEDRRWQDIRYVYALAVFPQFRGRGTAGKLLMRAYEQYHAPLIAQPAEESLVGGFYEPLGFQKAFYLNRSHIELPFPSVQAAEIRPAHGYVRMPQQDFKNIRHADAFAYNRIRDAHFTKRGFVSWPLRHTAFALQEHEAGGGGALTLTKEGREHILLYYMEGGQAVITETTLEAEEAAQVLDGWLKEPCSGVTLALRAEPAICNNRMLQADTGTDKDADTGNGLLWGRLNGVIYGIRPPYGYLNLTLD